MPARTNGAGVQVEDTKICVVMVGLPARGKSYVAQKGELEGRGRMPTPWPAYPQIQF
jgi:6-phosphofructo-2-kinase/fructose-2,6-biphosphatase 2